MGVYLVGCCYFYFTLRQCDVHVPVCHKATNTLIPQQAGVIPIPTGSHYQGLVLRYIERAASATNPCIYCIPGIYLVAPAAAAAASCLYHAVPQALYYVAATVQQQSHSKSVWTTSMRVLAFRMYACVMFVCYDMIGETCGMCYYWNVQSK